MRSRLAHEIDAQLESLMSVRAVFPYMGSDMLGKRTVRTAPLYRAKGLDVRFHFPDGLTRKSISKVNGIGHWVNQSYIIRLCALLEANGVIPSRRQGRIDQAVDGHKDIDILRRLRGVFAHTDGQYDREKSEHRKLYNKIRAHYNLAVIGADKAASFPLSIDTVLIPLTKRCRSYADEVLSRSKATDSDALTHALRCSLKQAVTDAKKWFETSSGRTHTRTEFEARAQIPDTGEGSVYVFLRARGRSVYVGQTSRRIKNRLHDQRSPHKMKRWWDSWSRMRFVTLRDETDRKVLEMLLILAMKPTENEDLRPKPIQEMF